MPSPKLSPETFNQDVIDQAFGRDADLYKDVLQVSFLASDREIQKAFSDRRTEIYSLVSDVSFDKDDGDETALSQLLFAERRMNATVMAFQILKDPKLRSLYDKYVRNLPSGEVKPKRSKQSKKNNSKGLSPVPFSSREANKSMDTEPTFDESESESELSRNFSSFSSSGSYDHEDRNDYEETELHDDYEEEPTANRGNGGVLAKIRGSHLVRTITEEVHGAYLDTYSAFDQVFNAFTLHGDEIEAFVGRIETAKLQLSTT